MRLRGGPYLALPPAVWILASALAGAAGAAPWLEHRFSGSARVETRWFRESPAHADQGRHASGFAVAPRLYFSDPEGRSLSVAPFFRYDSADPRRTHADLREAALLLFGEVGDGEWELRAGLDQVFWGVAESQHLVDIINQVDFVEHPDGEVKLGQPMAHLTWSGDWGAVEVFGLPFHRPRTFPGPSGRLRLPLVVDENRVEYESEAGARHLDLAARYSHGVGPADIGLSLFRGTSREPFFLLGAEPGGGPILVQRYEQIRQAGLDVQLTTGSWLIKLEAIHRAGARNRLDRDEDYAASVLGAEYTLYSVLGSTADAGLLGEWSYDGRGPRATPGRSPNTLENDLFLGGRFALNDVQSTEILGGLLMDLERSTRTLAIELNRRISGRWSLRLEAIDLIAIDAADLHYPTRRDSFVDLGLSWNL